jgi:hypothetical protein
MKSLLSFCLIGLLVGLPLYLLYWNLFRPVLIKRLKYRIYQCRDEMRLLLASDTIGQKEKAYPLLEKYCNKAISKIDDVDLLIVFPKKHDKRIELEAERDIGIILESPLLLRKFFFQITISVLGAACANSPGVLLLIAPVFILAVTIFWFNKTKIWATGLMKCAFGSFYLQPA